MSAAGRSVWDGVALGDPNGPVAVGGDLDVPTLAAAFRHGIFPWPPGSAAEAADLRQRFGAAVAAGQIPNLCPDRPATLDLPWWSPDPRGVLRVDQMHLAGSLRARLRRCGWHSTIDAAFAAVVDGCRQGRSSEWIGPDLVAAYQGLHEAGMARSIEVWEGPELVGGLYGVLVGPVFVGESMFHRRSDASKVAVADLCARLRAAGAALLDAQFVTPHLLRLGAVEIPRAEFLAALAGPAVRLGAERLPVARLVAGRASLTAAGSA